LSVILWANRPWSGKQTRARIATEGFGARLLAHQDLDVEILCWIDDHYRYALSATAHLRVTGPIVLASFRKAIDAHGVPAYTLTDNGMVFITRLSGGNSGRNGLGHELRRLRICRMAGQACILENCCAARRSTDNASGQCPVTACAPSMACLSVRSSAGEPKRQPAPDLLSFADLLARIGHREGEFTSPATSAPARTDQPPAAGSDDGIRLLGIGVRTLGASR